MSATWKNNGRIKLMIILGTHPSGDHQACRGDKEMPQVL